MYHLYGLRNCDTCRRARRALEARGLPVTSHDVRRDGMPATHLDAWIEQVGIDALINRRGRTWRALGDHDRGLTDTVDLRALLLREPTLMQRPVVVDPGGGVHVGKAALALAED